MEGIIEIHRKAVKVEMSSSSPVIRGPSVASVTARPPPTSASLDSCLASYLRSPLGFAPIASPGWLVPRSSQTRAARSSRETNDGWPPALDVPSSGLALVRSAGVVMSATIVEGMENVLCSLACSGIFQIFGNTAVSIGTQPQQLLESRLG